MASDDSDGTPFKPVSNQKFCLLEVLLPLPAIGSNCIPIQVLEGCQIITECCISRARVDVGDCPRASKPKRRGNGRDKVNKLFLGLQAGRPVLPRFTV